MTIACTLTLDSLGSVMAVSITESLWLGPSSGKRKLCELNIYIIKSFIYKNGIHDFYMLLVRMPLVICFISNNSNLGLEFNI